MTANDYPALYLRSDGASLRAQRTFLTLQAIYLTILILVSALGAISMLSTDPDGNSLHVLIAIVLAVGLLDLWILRARADDKVWFDARAVAESVKTATWRYMMKVPPFNADNVADAQFVSHLREIREARPALAARVATESEHIAHVISETMRRLRSSSLEERRRYYIDHRLLNQEAWYRRKAAHNLRLASCVFWLMTLMQTSALIIAILRTSASAFTWNATAVLMTLTAVVLAWSQLKRFRELGQSYALAASELQELTAIATGKPQPSQFEQVIEQCENSISREHTLWCARRDVRLRQ